MLKKIVPLPTKMERINRESICEILKPAGNRGLNVSVITIHLMNRFSAQLFNEAPLKREAVRAKVKRILAYEARKRRGGYFVRVKDPKTGKVIRGRYKLHPKALLCQPVPAPPASTSAELPLFL